MTKCTQIKSWLNYHRHWVRNDCQLFDINKLIMHTRANFSLPIRSYIQKGYCWSLQRIIDNHKFYSEKLDLEVWQLFNFIHVKKCIRHLCMWMHTAPVKLAIRWIDPFFSNICIFMEKYHHMSRCLAWPLSWRII